MMIRDRVLERTVDVVRGVSKNVRNLDGRHDGKNDKRGTQAVYIDNFPS